MPIISNMALTNSEGLGQILQFDGLGLKITIGPSVETLGEPVITKQAFYFLENLESVAKTRLENESVMHTMIDKVYFSPVMEYILDNYLFTYSLVNEESKLTSKIDEYGLLNTTPNDWYYLADKANTKVLAVDTLNDESVVECYDVLDPEMSFESDWRIFYNYFPELDNKYVKELRSLFEKKIFLKTRNGSAKEQILPIIQFKHKAYEYSELERLSYVNYVDKNNPKLVNGIYSFYPNTLDKSNKIDIPMNHCYSTNFYHKYLLDMYFAGLREPSLVVKFKHFYNILEYLFEDAALSECKKYLPTKKAKKIFDMSKVDKWKKKLKTSFPYSKRYITSEKTHLQMLFNMTINKNNFINKIKNYDLETKNHFLTKTPFNKSMSMKPLDLDKSGIIDAYATRIYTIRNGVIHTKRKRHGKDSQMILPFSENERFLQKEIMLLKYVVQEVIQKERTLFQLTTLSFSPREIGLFTELLFENRNYHTFVGLFEDFIINLSVNLSEIDFNTFLDRFTFILITIIDEARLETDTKNIDYIRNELLKIDCNILPKSAKYMIKCIVALLHRDVPRFNTLIDNVTKRSIRAYLYIIQNSLGLHPIHEREQRS
ncbi:MAG: hypothetical protein NWE89_01940 [Candidatus Bathyarchaeota archaeon]|nr:hypothetical protein [Candidatus Bathyarchaeota archaeon]